MCTLQIKRLGSLSKITEPLKPQRQASNQGVCLCLLSVGCARGRVKGRKGTGGLWRDLRWSKQCVLSPGVKRVHPPTCVWFEVQPAKPAGARWRIPFWPLGPEFIVLKLHVKAQSPHLSSPVTIDQHPAASYGWAAFCCSTIFPIMHLFLPRPGCALLLTSETLPLHAPESWPQSQEIPFSLQSSFGNIPSASLP